MNFLAKFAVEAVVSISVGHVIGEAVRHITPENLSVVNKIKIAVGAAALGSVIGGVVSAKIADQVGELAAVGTAVKDSWIEVRRASKLLKDHPADVSPENPSTTPDAAQAK